MKNVRLLFIACIALCCSSEDDLKISERFAVTGKVTSITETRLGAVTVTFYSEMYPDSVQTVITGTDGTFSIRLSIGVYHIEVSRDGYTSHNQLVTVSQSLDSLLMTLTGNAAVSGTVIDSQTGDGLEGATVSFTRSGLPELMLTSDDSGHFEIAGAPTGIFMMVAEREGFFTRGVDHLVLQDGLNEIANAIAVSKPKEGELRIVLSWGEYPLDLDSHLTGPTVADEEKRFHVYWDNKSPEAAVSLDVDDVYSFGPETITIKHVVPNRVYYYYVHNYEPQDPSVSGTEIAESPASVEVYDSTGLIGSFTPSLPATASNNLWNAFRMFTWPKGTYLSDEEAVSCGSNFCIDFEDDYYFVPLNEEGTSSVISKSNGTRKQKIDVLKLK